MILSEHMGKSNLTETKNDQKKSKPNRTQAIKNQKNEALKPLMDINKRKDVEYFVCWKKGQYGKEYHHRRGNKAKAQANLSK